MADEEQDVEVTKLSDKVLQQLKKAFGMSAEDKFEARKIHKYAGAATGKAAKIGGAALVGGAKGMFSGISKMFKAGWWIALFPFFHAIKWIFKGVMAIIKLPVFATLGAMFGGGLKAGGSFLLRAFKVLLRPFIIIGSIWKFAEGWANAHDLDKDGIITKTEKFYSGLGEIVNFFSFGYIDAEAAGNRMKAWSESFKQIMMNPIGSWEKLIDWWKYSFRFNEDIVQPMLKKFNEFKASDFVKKINTSWDEVVNWWKKFNFTTGVVNPTVKAFKDAPAAIEKFWTSEQGPFWWKKGLGQSFWDMMFGTKKDGDTFKTGGFIGGIKEIFSEENVVSAIAGTGNIGLEAVKAIGNLTRFMLIGKGGSFSDPDSWTKGSWWGFMKDQLTPSPGESILGNMGEFIRGISEWFGSILLKLMIKFGRVVLEGIGVSDSMLAGYDRDTKLYLDNLAAERKQRENQRKLTSTRAGRMFNAAVDQDIEEDRKAEIAEIEADQKAYEEMKKEQDREDENRRAEWLALPFGKFGTFDKAFKTRTLSDFFDSTQTRDTSISGLSKDAKSTAEVIAKYFWDKGKTVRFTSGFRTRAEQRKAMIEREDGLGMGKNSYANARTLLTPEEWKAGPKTPARRRGVTKLMNQKGFGGVHMHGDGLDMAWPAGSRTDTLNKLAAMGIEAEGEGDHVHIVASKLFSNRPNQLMNQARAFTSRSAWGGIELERQASNIVVNAPSSDTQVTNLIGGSPLSPYINDGNLADMGFGFAGFK